MSRLQDIRVVTTPVSVVSMEEALQRTSAWALAGRRSYLCAVNVHSLIEATRDEALCEALQQADMNVPDGVPVVWACRMMGAPEQLRLFGPTVMWEACRQAATERIPVAFYGSTEETMAQLLRNLAEAFPTLKVAEAIAPPFGLLSQAEDDEMVARLNESGAGYVFVGLGAPKQEKWMAAHRGRVHAVMFGVGAGFDYHAGRLKRAPLWMQHAGLEWVYRLAQEPRRLWKRYLINNPVYVVRVGEQVLQYRFRRSGGADRPERIA